MDKLDVNKIFIFMVLVVSLFNGELLGDCKTPPESCWVVYAPTNFNPDISQFPPDSSIKADLDTLYSVGFRGLVTYASDGTLWRIPQIARQVGFTGKIIMGIWCPYGSGNEITNAINCTSFVDGYCIGNEGINDARSYCDYFGDTTYLAQVMDSLRKVTGKPVTTSEQIDDYFSGEYSGWLIRNSDFIFPNVHPWWFGIKDPFDAAAFTQKMYDSLKTITDKEIIIKETGFPSAGDAQASEQNQTDYFVTLQNTDVVFFYFEAFDQPWKNWAPVEPHWGLFTDSRSPKQVVESLQCETFVNNDEEVENGYTKSFSLQQNFPNPFNSKTVIEYTLKCPTDVTVNIYNVRGQRVRTLTNGFESEGHKVIRWDGIDEAGKKAPSGIYFYHLQTDNYSEVKKMLLIK
jgi:exo-beta-1,3-glucanase (GH17 family)